MSLTFAQHYVSRFQTYQDELLDRLATLVNIDSGTKQTEGINHVIAHLEPWFQQLGFSTTLYPTEPYGNNLVAKRKGTGHIRIMFVGHIDTVYPNGSAQLQPFSIRENRAYGPGVADMKSGILMGLYVLRALIEEGFEDYAELCFAINNDEEVGSASSKTLLSEIARSMDVGIILEPSRHLEIITWARKGTDLHLLEVSGIPSHSGVDPQKGRSAVIELAHKMIAIQNLNSLYPGTTFNVTCLSSSETLNIVPDMARCSISVRAFSQQALDEAAKALEQIGNSHNVPGTSAMLKRIRGRKPYETTPELRALVELAQSEGEALGLHLQPEHRGGVSDGNTLMEAGVPTLDSLGPTGHNTHNLKLEHLDLDTLSLRGALLAGIIRRICQSQSSKDNPDF